jgi:uncharacterized repeat protein (TIGR01451 family)
MTTHPVDPSSRAGFLDLPASSSSFRARAVLGTLIAFLALAGPAMGCTLDRPAPRRPFPSVKCAGGGGVSAAVSLVKSASVTSYAASQTPITYSYFIKNTGNVDLTVSVTDPHVGLSAISCPSGTLAAGASETCTATYTTTQADVDAGSISNTGTATGTSDGVEVTALSSLTISTVGTAALTLVKSASAISYSAPGTGITYSYLVTNTGTVDLSAVSVTDPQVGLSAVSCPNGTLAAATAETCTATYTTTQADVDEGAISNTGTVSGTPPTGPAVTATSSLTIPAVDTPALSLVKSANVANYAAPGVAIIYSYLVTNTGNVDLSAVSLTDPQPGLSAVTCPSPTLAPAASETCTASYTTTQTDVDAGSISNTGTANASAPDGSAVTATSSLTIPASDAPAISVVKTANIVNYSAPGIGITYSYKVTNTGNEDLNAISVTDPQPGLSAVSCPNPSLAPGVFETCTASYTTTQADVDAGSISNTGMASGTPQTGSAATATSTLTIPAVDNPAISLAKTANVTSYSAPGIVITYYYKVTNTGNVTMTAVSVTDPHVGFSAISCPGTSLAPGVSETCTATYTTTQADVNAGSISNTGTASGKAPSGSAVTATSSLTIPASDSAALTLVKSSDATNYSLTGIQILYSYRVTNTGNVSLSAVSVTDPHVGLSAISCPSTSLPPGALETCTATYFTTQADLDAGSISNTGTASGKPPSGPVVMVSSSLTIRASVTAALTLTKTANVTSYSATGTPITYSYKVTNTGNVSLTAVSVTDPHVGLSAISCPGSTLAPGASETCTATYTTTQDDVDAGSISNTGTASGKPPTGPTVTVTATLKILGTAFPEMSMVKTANVASYSAPGTLITYSYKVTNISNVDLTSVSVTDPHVGLSAISCPSTSLAPAAFETCTATYTTTQADLDAGSISNTGTASGKALSGPTVTATAILKILAAAAPAMSLVKTANVASYSAPGTPITYSYLVTNTGNVDLTAVSVTDPHVGVSAINCASASLAPGAFETCTATYTTTQADVDAGSISNTGTASGKPPTGPIVTATSTLRILATAVPAMSLAKTANVANYSAPGTAVTYSYLVTNIGNVDLTAVSVTDPHVGLSAISCPSASLAPGAFETCTATYTTTQADVDAGSISNTGTASGTSLAGPVVTATSSLTIQATASPKVSVVKTASVTGYSAPGTPITYSYRVTNTGNVDLTAMSVTDPHVGLSAVSCPSASLAPGFSETCTATYTTTQADVDAGSISNTGTASGTPPTGPAITATSSLTISASDTAKLTLAKTASAGGYSAPGTGITYFYLVTNAGNVDVSAVSVTDPQTGLSAVNCPSGTLAPAASETCTATYTTTQTDVDAGSISNTGTASGTPPNGSAVSATSSLTILASDTPAVSVVKSANVANYSAPGTAITYSYVVTNTGNVDLTAVSVTDPHAGLSAISCPSPSLAPGASETCTATYTTTQADVDAGSITNTGTASGTPPTGPAVTATSSLTIPASDAPSVSVVKSANVVNYSAPGTAITYFYKVTNTGNVDLSAVLVTDPQSGLRPISCPSPSLAPTASQTCTATYTTTQADLDAGSISNIGTASGTPPTGPAVTATSSLTIPAIDTPAMSLVKSASVTSYSAPGTPITYSYKVTNTGNVNLTAVSVTDPHVGLSAISCTSASLAPAATETCTATYTTTQADITAGSITNTASASGKAPSGVSVASNPSSVTIPAATVSVTVATSTSGPTISVDGGSYTGTQSFTWTVGSQHTLATTSPETPTAGTQYTFASWSDGGAISHSVTASAGTTSYNASFNTSYLLTTGVSPGGSGTVSPASGSYYVAGTPVPLVATAATGYKFANWTGPVASAGSASTNVTMSGPESVTANFVVNNVGVTINTSPSGLAVSVDGGTPQAAPVPVTWQVGSPHTIATTSPQAPTAGTQYTFASWSDGGTISHPVTASAGTTSYNASFNTSYLLTTGVSPGGGGTVSPASGSYYAAGTPVPLVATAATGYKFANWTGPVASASSASTNVTMSGPESVTANFVVNNVGVTINTSLSGLAVSVDGGTPHAAPVAVSWQVGSPHTIATTSPQTPSAGTRYTFANWSDSGAISHPVTASAGTLSYSASFSTSYLLTAGVSPSGGGTVSPASGSYYAAGTPVPLVATPSAGYVFSSWTGPVASASSASTNVTMTGPESVTANFISALTVSPSPSYNFGTVYLGTVTTENFTVTNRGTTPINISGPFISIVKGGDSKEFVEVDECPKSLAGGSHCTISVTFIAGPFYTPQTATLSIMDNAPGNPQTVTLTATVIDPQASFNPTSLSFGNQTVNTSVTKTVTLKNTGATTLSITGMTVTGAGATEFTLTPASNCGSSLTAGNSCTISVTFKPAARVSYSATLNVTDDARPGTQTVPLSGIAH